MASMFLLLVAFAASQPSAEFAALEIQSQPGVEVVWEGVSLGRTDNQGLLVVEEIPPGRYAIAIRKQGFREVTRELELVGGQTNTFQLDLEEIKPSRNRAAVRPPPRARPTRSKSIAQPEKAEAMDAGKEFSGPRGNSSPRAEQPTKPIVAAAALSGESGKDVESGIPSPAADLETAVKKTGLESGSGRLWRIPLLVLVVLGFGTGLYFLGRFRGNLFSREWDDFSSEVALEVEKAVPPPPLGPEVWEPPARQGRTVSPEADEPGFIEDLKRREKDLERSGSRRPRRSQPEVIDADFIEVLDAEVDA